MTEGLTLLHFTNKTWKIYKRPPLRRSQLAGLSEKFSFLNQNSNLIEAPRSGEKKKKAQYLESDGPGFDLSIYHLLGTRKTQSSQLQFPVLENGVIMPFTFLIQMN